MNLTSGIKPPGCARLIHQGIDCMLKDTTVRPLKRTYEPNQWDKQ